MKGAILMFKVVLYITFGPSNPGWSAKTVANSFRADLRNLRLSLCMEPLQRVRQTEGSQSTASKNSKVPRLNGILTLLGQSQAREQKSKHMTTTAEDRE